MNFIRHETLSPSDLLRMLMAAQRKERAEAQEQEQLRRDHLMSQSRRYHELYRSDQLSAARFLRDASERDRFCEGDFLLETFWWMCSKCNWSGESARRHRPISLAMAEDMARCLVSEKLSAEAEAIWNYHRPIMAPYGRSTYSFPGQ